MHKQECCLRASGNLLASWGVGDVKAAAPAATLGGRREAMSNGVDAFLVTSDPRVDFASAGNANLCASLT